MVDLAKLTAANLTRWKAASVTPSLIPTVDAVSHRLVAAKARYQTVEAKTGVPWAAIADVEKSVSDLRVCPPFEHKPLDLARDTIFNAAPKILMVLLASV
jgi:lysozyme family protein